MIERVEYEEGEGKIYINDSQSFPFTPSILIHPRIAPLLDLPPIIHAPYSQLVEIERYVRKISSLVLLLPPERQFLLKKNLSYHQTPGKLLPEVKNDNEALEFLLREKDPSNIPKIFLENIYFLARHPVSFERIKRRKLSPETLRVVIDWNIDPTSLGKPGRLLPTSLVRVKTDPILFPSLTGRTIVAKNGSLVPLIDAEFLGLPYTIERKVTVSTSPAPLPASLLSLLSLSSTLFSLSPKGRSMEEILKHSEAFETNYYLLKGIARIFSSLPSFLASTEVLTPPGLEAFLALSRLLLRSPKVYMRLLTNNSACSPSLKGLGSSLQGPFNWLMALLHS